MMVHGTITMLNEAGTRGLYVVRYRHHKWELHEYEYVSYDKYEDAVRAFKNLRMQQHYTEVKLYELQELVG